MRLLHCSVFKERTETRGNPSVGRPDRTGALSLRADGYHIAGL